MKLLRAAILGAALGAALAPLGAVAQISGGPSTSNGPMDISADNGTFDNAACESTWSGAAEVLQGTTRLRATTIKAFFKKKPAAANAPPPSQTGAESALGMPGGAGSNCGATERIVADGDVFYVTPEQVARGDHAIYSADSGQIVMTGDVIIVQGKNVIHGNHLVIQVATHQAQMESDAHGRGVPNRVRAVLFSNQPGGLGLAPAPAAH
jgi:lipopolysaccharide export system protein LptA